MKTYLVKVMFEFEDDILVQAEDVYQANAIAEQKLAEVYSVYNNELEDFLPFSDVIAYDPEEQKQ